MRLAFVVGIVMAAVVCGSTARAHPPTIVDGGAEKATGEEVLDFRKRLAASARDPVKLKAFYADTFQHTTTDARVQNREVRIALVASGAPTIETTAPDEITIRVHAGGWTAVAFGVTSFKRAGFTTRERWTATYVRSEKDWLVAASQSTRIANISR